MLDVFVKMLGSLFLLVKYPLYIILGICTLFVFMCSIFIVIGFAQGRRFKKGSRRVVKKHGFFRSILIDLPKQYVDDLFCREPDFFPYQGLIIFEGRQGKGKTISMIEYAMRMQKEFPKSKVLSNCGYTKENAKLNTWKKLVNYNNDKEGVVVIMDELQNWFSSNQSKNFPPEMLSVITQNRKNRRIILGTSQNFYLLAKAIRSQATEVRRCTTLLGCLTIVKRLEPFLDSEGNVVEFKNRGMYFFVHNKEIRESYDTYKVIESLSKSGFKEVKPDQAQIINKTVIVSK